jgi:antitoxin FitA
MANITVKGLPDDLHARLKAQAERNRRSLNAEAIECIERGLGTAAVDPAELRKRLRLVRERGAGYLTEDMVDQGKKEGRP